MDTSPARASRPGSAATFPTDGTAPAGSISDPAASGAASPDDTGLLPRIAGRRRRGLLALLGVVAALSAAGLVLGLLSWAPDPPVEPRALTVAESERLAAVRVTNYRELRTGLHVTVRDGAARTELMGWIDWSRPLLYLDVGGPGAGPQRGLLQATPTALVIRPDPAAVPTAAPPPLVPPTDRWRLHRLPDGNALAPVLDLLFGLSADRPESADALRDADARWVARETLTTGPVDVFTAPLPAPSATAAPSTSTSGGLPRYWVDQEARLHRLTAHLPGVGPVTVTLNRTDRPTLRPVDVLGGRPGLPREPTAAERDRLEKLPARLRAHGGATVTLSAPIGRDTNLRGTGWLSWTDRSAYLAVADLGVPDRRTLLRRDAAGWSQAEVPGAGDPEKPNPPPLPPPAGTAWRPHLDTDEPGRLLDAALAAGRAAPPRTAERIREDSLVNRTVDVVEVDTGASRLRYWVDRDGLLRRVELHTGGAWAQLDLTPGPVPHLAAPRRATGGAR